ncbi:MAG TPA: cation:proton antiporter [Candidatus Methanoperedens sp.]|nr:cation:proton antiporter [Candidatus Methanoperedens sp.]HLB71739.1 cation:proton antiporter [Candidatus Methanoperedens sp.]
MYDVFFLIGAVLILGFITSMLFERTKIPDIILLMFTGMLLGPILKIVSIEGPISTLAPYIGTLALIIILFDGGLNLNLIKVLTSLAKASGFTVLVFSLTVVFLGIVMNLIFGWKYIDGLLLGAVVGGTSSAIVIPIISKLTMKEDSKVLLSLESALTDALCVVVTIALIEIISLGTVNIRDTAGSIASAFSTAAVIAVVFAVFWIGILNKLYIKQVGYSLTLAVVFILYSIVELVRSNGAIAVLVFALLLSNFGDITQRLKIKGEFKLDTTLRAFQVEVSFFVRTFFFIFTGLMFNLEALNNTALIMASVVFMIILLTRTVGVKVLIMNDKNMSQSERSMISMMPRGLAAAVLASMPLAAGIEIPYFIEIVFSIIILTNLATTIGVFAIERKIAISTRNQKGIT